MLSKSENELLTRVGPGTPMGELMRRYWQPIAAASQLEENPTKAVRLLGEDLTLYRDRSGTLGLIGDRCPHRKVSMLYGIPEQTGLRCAYHGWVFNEEGRCIEQPYEEDEDPGSNFKEKVRTKAYHVQELSGLIFAYLGPEPAPLLPRWDLLAFENVYRDIGMAIIPCNWLQIMENSVDPVHAEWLHGVFANYVHERQARLQDVKPIPTHKKIGFDIFEYGILKRRVLNGEDEESPNWTVGHPLVFPNFLKVGGYQYRTPMDDTHTLHIWYTTYQPADGTTVPAGEPIPFYEVPMVYPDERGNPDWEGLNFTAGQDVVMWSTQGAIADRSTETLGRSDKGIILFRRLLKENLETVMRGEDPMNVFRDPEKAKFIHLPHESAGGNARRLSAANNSVGSRGGGGGATNKYSPILKTRQAQAVSVGDAIKQ